MSKKYNHSVVLEGLHEQKWLKAVVEAGVVVFIGWRSAGHMVKLSFHGFDITGMTPKPCSSDGRTSGTRKVPCCTPRKRSLFSFSVRVDAAWYEIGSDLLYVTSIGGIWCERNGRTKGRTWAATWPWYHCGTSLDSTANYKSVVGNRDVLSEAKEMVSKWEGRVVGSCFDRRKTSQWIRYNLENSALYRPSVFWQIFCVSRTLFERIS